VLVIHELDLDKIFSMSEQLGISELEVVLQKQNTLDTEAVKDKIEKTKYTVSIRLGYRVLVGRRKATYGATISSIEDAVKSLEEAVKIARISPEDPYWRSIPRKLGGGAEIEIYDHETSSMDPNKSLEIVLESISTIKEHDKRSNPIAVRLSTSSLETVFANNYGEEAYRKETIVFYIVGARAEEAGKEGVYYEYKVLRRLRDLDHEGLAKRAASRAIDSLYAKQIETMKTNIVFENKIWASILTALFVPAVAADNVQEKRSPLAGKIGEQVFAEEISIVDDPHKPWLYGSKNVDDEGIRTSAKYVVRNGVIETYLYDYYTALRENRESTGNAYRRQPWSNPRPWPTNLILLPGRASIDEVIEDTRRGILVAATIGEWLSNPISGQLNATISHGYLIENGEIARPIKGMTISTQFYDALKNKLGLIAKDQECNGNVCSPTISLRDVVVAGK